MKFGKKLKRAALKTVRFAHKITHEGPIGKLHDKIAKAVPKPFSAFVKIGTASSKQIHKMMTKAGILKKTASPKAAKQAILEIRGAARRELRKRAKAGNQHAVKALGMLKRAKVAAGAAKPREVKVGGFTYVVTRK